METTHIAETARPYLAQFDEIGPGLPGARTWLGALRRDAIARFAETGPPNARMEDWRFTDLRRLTRTTFAAAAAAPAPDLDWIAPWYLDGPCHRLVFINGRFEPRHSDIGALPPGVRLQPFAEAVSDQPGLLETDLARGSERADGSLVDLNTAMMRDGLVLRLDAGVRLDAPVQLVHVAVAPGDPVAVHPRVLVAAGDGSRASVFETYLGIGDRAYWTNAVAEIFVGPDASVSHVKLQQEGAGGFHTGFSRRPRPGVSPERVVFCKPSGKIRRSTALFSTSSILRTIGLSECVAKVKASPVRSARPVRPMRWV